MGQSVVASLGLDDAATFRPIRRRRFDRRPTRVDIGSGTNPGKTPEDRTGGAGVRGHQRPVVAECDGPRPRHRLHLGAKMVGRVGDMLPIVVRKQDYRRCPVCVDAGRAGGLPVRSDALRYQGAQDHRAGRHKYDEQLRLVLLAASHGFFGLSIGAREWHVQPGCGSLCLAKKKPEPSVRAFWTAEAACPCQTAFLALARAAPKPASATPSSARLAGSGVGLGSIGLPAMVMPSKARPES